MSDNNYVVVCTKNDVPMIYNPQGLAASTMVSEERACMLAREYHEADRARVYACVPAEELERLRECWKRAFGQGIQLGPLQDEARAAMGLAAGFAEAEQFASLERIRDPEIDAMATIAQALEPLDERQRNRVLAWTCARYGAAPQPRVESNVRIGAMNQ